ncbi:efflux transporter outer membrane subunit [Novispirillum sp. DQ9]|uniref:efflux transporter outer membrane subunit n=1 Tax=Novispirillum sp. DQ9 TaxID=3398612 RepID=UPI003C7D9572
MHRTLPVLALLAVAGCAAAGEPAAPPAAPPASSWVNAPPTAAAPTAIPERWWEIFGSDELSALVAQARRDNPDLAAARQRIAQARAQARAARAVLFPTLDGGGGASRSWPGEGMARNGFNAGFDAAYEVDLWGGARAGATAAEATARATAFDQDAATLSLSADVATTYFQILSLNDRLASARRILDIAERIQALVETQEALGAASGLEVARQRGAVAAFRASIPTLERARAESRNALAQLLGTSTGAVALRAETLDAVRLPEIVPGLPSGLLTRRPDLKAAEAALAAASADVAVARAAMLPSIRLTGGGGYSSAELSSLFSPAGFLANLAAGLTAPVFDAGRLEARRAQAQAAEAQAVEQYRSAIVAAFRDVEDALAGVRFLAEIEAARQDARAQAADAYAIAEERYRVGRTDFLDLLDAQRTLFEQEDALREARLSRLNASVALYEALGGGWMPDDTP